MTRKPPDVRLTVAGSLVVELYERRAQVAGLTIDLTELESAVLITLFERQPRVCHRDELFDAIWGPRADVKRRVVGDLINRLRVKLGPAAGCIQCERGRGYRLHVALLDAFNGHRQGPSGFF